MAFLRLWRHLGPTRNPLTMELPHAANMLDALGSARNIAPKKIMSGLGMRSLRTACAASRCSSAVLLRFMYFASSMKPS